MENSNKSKSPTRNGRVWLVFLLGVATTAFGVTYTAAMPPSESGSPPLVHMLVGGVVASLGGGVLGSTMGLLISHASGQETTDQIRELLTDTLESRFTSPEDALQSLRRTWYHYHVTGFTEGTTWRHRLYHFDLSTSIGSIVSSIEVNDSFGLAHRYRLEAGVRGPRLIIIQTRMDGEEPPIIQIYPNMTQAFQNVHCGVSFMQNWVGQHIVTRSILSRVPLVPDLKEGTVPEGHSSHLDATWSGQFTAGTTILPGYSVPPTSRQSHE